VPNIITYSVGSSIKDGCTEGEGGRLKADSCGRGEGVIDDVDVRKKYYIG